MDLVAAFLPEGLPLWAAFTVIIVSLFTSAFTAAMGVGGGLALLAFMSAVLPASAVIPLHGVGQLGSNASRFILQRPHVVWPIALWFAGGSIIGASLGGRLAVELPAWALRAGVGFFVLYTVWGPRPESFAPGLKTFFATGIVGGFLTMFFGATGPIAATMLGASTLGRLNIVATHAACMVFQHGLKIAIFGLLGFAYAEWAAIICAMLIAGYGGAVLGTRLLHHMNETAFKRAFNIALTVIAAYLLVLAFGSLRTG